MPLQESIREEISMEVIKTLVSRFEKFPKDARSNRNAPFHEAFLEAFKDKLEGKVSDIPFFITLSSWLHGLNTTIGQIFFEKVANILFGGKKKEFTSGRDSVLNITSQQSTNISNLITKLSNDKEFKPNLKNENEILFVEDNTELIESMGFSADVFLEKEDSVYAIEIKSVRPNSGEMRGEKEKILHGKAALYKKYPRKKINFFIGFPFDPTIIDKGIENKNSYDKQRFVDSCINMGKYFAFEEILIANELWDFLSGQKNTMNEIIKIINQIATTNFESKFKMLYDSTNWGSDEYISQLREWNLITEIELIENKSKNIASSKKAQDILIKGCFKEDGNYDWKRAFKLKSLIN